MREYLGQNATYRVLHVGLTSAFGGIESFLLNVSECMDPDVIFDYIAFDPSAPCREEFLRNLSSVMFSVTRSNPFLYARQLYTILQKGYDAVHIHKNTSMDFMPLLLAKFLGVKRIVVHAHNGSHKLFFSKYIVHRLGVFLNNRVATDRIACSEIASDWIFGKGKRGTEEILILHNGVNVDRFRFSQSLRSRFRSKINLEGHFLVGVIGRLTDQKNQSLLIRALQRIRKVRNDAVLLLAGCGPDERKLKNLAEKCGIQDSVIFLGHIEDTPEFFSGIDILAMPSKYEGFPIVSIEAQCSGLPIVASDRIAKEIDITGNVTWVSNSDSIEEWSDALMASASKSGCRDVSNLEDYTWDNISTRLRKLYLGK